VPLRPDVVAGIEQTEAHAVQKHFGQPSSGAYAFTSSSPASIRNEPGATRACADAAVPVLRWHRVQWQYPALSGRSVTSKLTPPHRQWPVYGGPLTPLHDNQAVRTTAKVDYAVRAAVELAASGDAPVSADRIAEAQHIPVNFLENILLDLRRAGIVESRRGAAGGYLLAKPAKEIVIADVVRAVEGPLASVRGLSPDALDYDGSAESLRDVWVALRSAVRSVLEHVTLADVAGGKLPAQITKLTREPDAWVRRSR
jgi:Rrf2 family protein